MTLNIAVFAPMPSAKVTMAIVVNAGCLSKLLIPNRMSLITVSIRLFLWQTTSRFLIGFGRRNASYLCGDTLPPPLALHENIRPTVFVNKLSSAIVVASLLRSPNHHRAVAVNSYFQIVRRRVLVNGAVSFQFFNIL